MYTSRPLEESFEKADRPRREIEREIRFRDLEDKGDPEYSRLFLMMVAFLFAFTEGKHGRSPFTFSPDVSFIDG